MRPLCSGFKLCAALLAVQLLRAARAQDMLSNCGTATFDIASHTGIRDRPCAVNTASATPVGQGKWLFSCLQYGGWVCSGPGVRGGPPVQCELAGILPNDMLGCGQAGSVYDTAMSSSGTIIFSACRWGSAGRCDWDPAAGQASNCSLISGVVCPSGETVGIEFWDPTGDLLLGCSDSRGRTGIALCPIDSVGRSTGGCTWTGTVGACGSAGLAGAQKALSYRGGSHYPGTYSGCTGSAKDEAAYCYDFDPVLGPAGCTAIQFDVAAGHDVYAVTPIGTEEVGVALFSNGWVLCSVRYPPTLSPSSAPSPLPTASCGLHRRHHSLPLRAFLLRSQLLLRFTR
eukprot:TRINITY_DN3004_c1_g3_i4.p1 TRINITY_DN3004_c1_g3~~TRINITY_DN3004_c1_g3_i4.p1  ORF type:complete len:342 (+),score=6.42 TRINITY_DN3004_c1_g3_i4:76-1101(+)